MSWDFAEHHSSDSEADERKTVVGDRVQLASGGPEMTVTAIQEAPGGGKILTCTWFSGEPGDAGTENLHSINLPDAAIVWLGDD